MKFFFETYGCQMNIAESAALAIAAKERGWEEAPSPGEADLVLINTCSVRATAEQRVLGRLAHYSAYKKKRAFSGGKGADGKSPPTLVLAGCMAERVGEELKKEYPALDFTIGTQARWSFPLVLEAVEKGVLPPNLDAANSKSDIYDEKPVFKFSPLHLDGTSPYRSFVPIMHGCDNFCSYCIVPYVRGREVSRDPASILEEIRLLSERGVREITLLGQNVNSYCWDGLGFPGLLELIARHLGDGVTGGIRWVRFLSSHPKDFSPDLIHVIAENPVFCRHIHLCVQHGSNRMLAAMNRRYTREQYLDLVFRLRTSLPDLSLSTDFLVGFPGETEDDFSEMLSLMEEVKFLYAYMYHYNPREGTAAFSLPGRISAEVKKERLSRVIALQKRHTSELLKRRLGMEVDALIEGISRKNADELVGRTGRDEMVVVPGRGDLVGSFASLTLSSLSGNTFRCKKVPGTFLAPYKELK